MIFFFDRRDVCYWIRVRLNNTVKVKSTGGGFVLSIVALCKFSSTDRKIHGNFYFISRFLLFLSFILFYSSFDEIQKPPLTPKNDSLDRQNLMVIT